MIQSIVHFVSFLKSIERKILLQKWLPYSDRFGVKKNLFSYALQTLALKYIYLYALLSTYLSGEHSKKKTCQASEKTPQNPGLVVLSIYFPIFHPSRCCLQTRFRAETRTNIWCRDFHEIRASYLYSIPEHRAGLGWSQNEIYGFLAVGKICT